MTNKKNESFSMYALIEKKKHGLELSKNEIDWIIKDYTSSKIPDYQMSALLMAIYFKGMSTLETQYLTDAMLYSGKTLELKDQTIVDKHSTGGIGDKTSFILAPIAAAAGVKVPMIAGRGLGFTGGTVDKIECIPGFNTSLTLEQFKDQLLGKGIVLMGQTPEIAPADRLIYALRDVTATVDSIPLITASIMSKKLAEGTNGIVLDIKWGTGAFMSQQKDAIKLAHSLIQTAKRFKKKAVALVTDMNQPLGKKIGNSLEILESIETLKGNGPKDLSDLSFELAAHMIVVAKKAKTMKEARNKVKTLIENGEALKKFAELISLQGGDASYITHPEKIKVAPIQTALPSPKNGFVKAFDNKKIGLILVELGGGRKSKDDKLDLTVGFDILKKKGDAVKKGESLITFYHHPEQKNIVEDLKKYYLNEVLTISATKTKKTPLINKTILS